MQNDSTLRAVAARLTTTSVEDLPRISGFLASSLAQCQLEQHFTDTGKSSNASVTVHKLKTRITSLLQDRTVAGRCTAAVLIKAVVEHGGVAALSGSDVWARGLLSCLNKPDPHAVKKIYLSTLTRMFALTQDHPTLLRELTTKLLPPFVTACFGLLKPAKSNNENACNELTSPLLEGVLRSWAQFLPHHPTIFRPFAARIRLICQSLLENNYCSSATRQCALQILTLLLATTPKNTFASEWTQAANDIVGSAHDTADLTFRAVLEEYEPNDHNRQRPSRKHDFSKEPKSTGKDRGGLDAWRGIYEGTARIVTHLDLLASLISTPSPQVVSIPLGLTLDLTTRMLMMLPPGFGNPTSESLRMHSEASKEEKEQLWLNVPKIHHACFQLLQRMAEIYGEALLPAFSTIFGQILDLLRSMSRHSGTREDVYDTIRIMSDRTSLLQLNLSKNVVSILVENCCQDLKKAIDGPFEASKSNTSKDGFLITKEVSAHSMISTGTQSSVYSAASKLLPVLFSAFPASLISRQQRNEMDRLSVLLNHKAAMLASVMHPVLTDNGKATTASLLPFLARSVPGAASTEALLRPRMPVLQTGQVSEKRSSNENITANHDEDDELDEVNNDNDILSRLEDSLDAPEETAPEEAAEADGEAVTPGTENHDSPASHPDIKGKKRAIDDSTVEPHQTPLPPSDTPAPPFKIPRLEEKYLEESTSHAPIPNLGSLTSSTSDPWASRDTDNLAYAASSSSMAAKIAAFTNDDSDSSEFEMPIIDPTPDTDEEDEDEE